MTDVERIAKGLTEPQRDFVAGQTGKCSYADFEALSDCGLILPDWGDDLFTPLGLEIRNYLIEQSHDHQ